MVIIRNFVWNTVIAASLLCAAPSFAAEVSPIRSISATGFAERKIAPDEGHVHVNFGATNLKLELAKAEHDKKLRTVMEIAKKSGIDAAQVKTENSSVQPQYSWDNNKQTFKGYRVQTMLDVTVKKIEDVGGLVEKLTSSGIETGGGQEWGNLLTVSYNLAHPEKIRDEMLAEAIKNARAKAENMAKAAGGSVGNAIQVSEGGAPSLNFAPPMMAMAAAPMMEKRGGGGGEAPPIGEQTVNANVSVIFELR